MMDEDQRASMRRKNNKKRLLFAPTQLLIYICMVALGGLIILGIFDAKNRYVYQWNSEDVVHIDADELVEADDVFQKLETGYTIPIAFRYKLLHELGSGFVSRAYKGFDVVSNESVVLKFTYINVTENTSPIPLKGIPDNVRKLKALENEYETYYRLKGTRLLQAYYYGNYNGFKVLVTQYGGESVIQLQEKNWPWSKEDVFQVAQNVLMDLQCLHDNSILHNDMHNGNIAIQHTSKRIEAVHLIDFNSCKLFRDPTSLQHKLERKYFFRVPIHRFSPPCFFKKKTCSRRDDLASLGYLLVMLSSEHAGCAPLYSLRCPGQREGYWFSPSLPWIDITGKQNLIDFMKNISFNILNAPNNYRDQLPPVFRKYFEHLESLQFDSKPSYDYLINLFAI